MNKQKFFIFTITSLFVAASLMVTLLIINNYQNSLSTNRTIIDNQLALAFVNENTKRATRIQVITQNDTSILKLDDDNGYATYLYYYQDELYELYQSSELAFELDYGSAIIATNPLDFYIDASLLRVTDLSNSNFVLIDLEGRL